MTVIAIYIQDTNIWLTRPTAFLDYAIPDSITKVILLKSVLQEIDLLKSSQDQAGFLAREASKTIYSWMNQAVRTQTGWSLSPTVEFILDERTEGQVYLNNPNMIHISTDDRILDCTEYYKNFFVDDKVYLVTRDQNLGIRAINRDVTVLDPTGWFRPTPNQYALPMLSDGMPWAQDNHTGFCLPVIDLEGIPNGQIELWSYWGHQTGEVSCVHIRYFAHDVNGNRREDVASPLIVLATEPQIPYYQSLANIPYLAFIPQTGVFWELPFNELYMRLDITNASAYKRNVTPNYNGAINNGAIALGLNSLFGGGNLASSIFTGAALGQAARANRSAQNEMAVFSSLGIKITISPARNLGQKPAGYFFSNYIR